MSSTSVRPGQVEQVGVAGDVARMVGEALAAIVLGVEPRVLDHRPPRAVEHEDPLIQQLPQTLCCAHYRPLADVPKEDGAEAPSSLGVFYPGRQAAFKAVQVTKRLALRVAGPRVAAQ